MLFKILLLSFFIFSCGVKKAPISKRKIPSIFEEYKIQTETKEDTKSKKDSKKK